MIRWLRRLFGFGRWRFVTQVPITRPSAAMDLGRLYLEVRLRVWIETASGALYPVDFLVDSGACMSGMSLAHAEENNLAVPPAESAVALNLGLAGGASSVQAMRPGMVRVRFSADPDAPAVNWPMRFMENWPSNAKSLLGLNSLVGRFRWVFDGTPQVDAPWGVFSLFVRAD